MKRLLAHIAVPLALLGFCATSWAHGHKEEYWDGHCKVERKWKKNGEYKEKRKCRGDRPVVYQQPQSVYMAPPPPPVMVRPARPEIVISPQIVIRP